ncbi:hypothetical protein K488DRAFT_84415 [Vararia minispora EC-137]|uniref:Uncharacterized protein n=1 Tax=Vararia minispora EC-137 TaxID=1314806 RepID=A0ACB8QQ53_9AGAM|nr:hypothetical protein K488DRAFT_84415 [Vararia minispora EC-137]
MSTTPWRLVLLVLSLLAAGAGAQQCQKTSTPVWATRGAPVARGLGDLLAGGGGEPERKPAEPLVEAHKTETNPTTTTTSAGPFQHFTVQNTATTSPLSTQTTTTPVLTHSAVPTSQETKAPTSTSSQTPSSTATFFATGTASKPGNINWRVVAIAGIAVGAVGSIILGAVFFEQCMGFADDVCCGGRRRRKGGPDGMEEFVPDWKRGSWAYRSRVPSFSRPSPGTHGTYAAAEEVVGSPPPPVVQQVPTTLALAQPRPLGPPAPRSPVIQMRDWLYRPGASPHMQLRRDAQPPAVVGPYSPHERDLRAAVSPFTDHAGTAGKHTGSSTHEGNHTVGDDPFRHQDDAVTSPTTGFAYSPEDVYGGMVQGKF